MKKILFLLLPLFALSACKEEFLESTPYGQSVSSTFWRNAADALAGANAMYEPLRNEEFYGHSEQTFEICGDDFWRAGDHGEDQAIEDFTFDASNAQLGHSYNSKYEIVNRANAVILNVPNITMDKTLKDRILGEAYFLRGFANWRLHVIYGEVVLISDQDLSNNNFNKPKSGIEEVRKAIEEDWIKAVALLPATYGAADLGRPTSGTVNGFLAKFYLHTDNLNKAIEFGDKVIKGPYALATNYNANFTIATENNPEMLFAVQNLDGWGGSSYRIYSTPRPWGGWDFHEPIQDLVDEFEPKDPRMDFTLLMPGEKVDLGGTQGVREYTKSLSLTGYHFNKFASWRKTTGGLDDGQNVPLLRTAEVYLIVAEAKIRLNGAGRGDAEINAVRKRVGMPEISNAGMTQLIHERRVELAGEAERHQDLMRWDRAKIIDIVAHYKKDRGQYKPSRNFQRPKHYYFALPQREIDLSQGVLKQNSNY